MRLSVLTLVFILFLSPVFGQQFDAASVNPFGLAKDGSRNSPILADLDADGDLDMLVGFASGDFGYRENTGTKQAPAFKASSSNPFGLAALGGSSSPFLVDLDDDGDLDLFAGSGNGVHYFENKGTNQAPNFGPAQANPFSIVNPSGVVRPYLVDIDNDDDHDLFVGATDGNTYYYKNTGTKKAPAFAASVTNPFGFSDVGNRSAPSFVDVDKDGDMDAFIGERNTGSLFYFRNTGTNSAPAFTLIGADQFGIAAVNDDAKPCFGDIDDDGDNDLMIGDAVGNYTYHKNTSPAGIKDFSLTNFFASPNPFTDQVMIRGGETSTTLKLFDLKGVLVYENEIELNASIDLTALKPGIFVAELHSGKTFQRIRIAKH